MENNESNSIKLSNDNYLQWKTYISCALKAKYVWRIASGQHVCPAPLEEDDSGPPRAADVNKRNKEILDWEANDALAGTIIFNSLNKTNADLIVNCSTSFEMYSTIINHKEQRTTINKWNIRFS